jgi:glyoxylase-like metal-dependent hydrolase (beta-lactamase superfamily II)
MEILPGVHQIDVPFAGRVISVYLLLGKRTLLVDSGVVDSPETTILPYLQGLGVGPRDLWGVVNTHADADHCGGNYSLKRANPNLRIVTLVQEKDDVESPMSHVRDLYEPYRSALGDLATDQGIRWNEENLGPGVVVDCPAQDGDLLTIDDGWSVQVHLAAGHTRGHLALYDPVHQAALVGDAVLWKGVVTDGRFTNIPPYGNVDAYLATIRKVRSWPSEYLCTSHYSTLRGKQLHAFLEESEAFVLAFDECVTRAVAELGASADLRRLTERALEVLGGGYTIDVCAVMATDAHLRRKGGVLGLLS